MAAITPASSIMPLSRAVSSPMTVGGWLLQFEQIASPTEIIQVANRLLQEINRAQTDSDLKLHESVNLLRDLRDPGRLEASLLERPLRDLIPASSIVRRDETSVTRSNDAKTWAGSSARSLTGYVGRAFLGHVGARLHVIPAAHRYYAPSDKRLRQALETYEFQALEAHPDEAERKVAFAAEHARNLDWAARHAEKLLGLVSPKTREFYEETRRKISDINLRYRAYLDEQDQLLAETSHLSPHAQNVALSNREMAIDRRIDGLEIEICKAEMLWEVRFYEDLMEQAQSFVPKPPRGDLREYKNALNDFRRHAAAEIDFRQRLLANDKDATPAKRKKLEEAAYRTLMHGRDLHSIVRNIFRSIGHAGAEDLESPLTFVWKSQSFRHAYKPSGMGSLERLVETMLPCAPHIKAAKKDSDLIPQLEDVAAVDWAIAGLAEFFDHIRLAAPAGVLTLTDHLSLESSLIRGAMQVFDSGQNDFAAALDESSPGVVSDQTHGDTMDYMAILASRYLFWGPDRKKPSIVAESIFKYIPYMGDFLALTARGFLSRKDREKREHFLNVTLKDQIAQGRDIAQFGEGTRRLSNPFAARYSDLNHPGALHNPGEFLAPGPMRGMQFRLSLASQADVHVYAAKIHSGGSGEPSIPRDLKGFVTPNYTEFSYRPPWGQNGFVALAGIMRYRDQIKSEDFPGQPMHRILARNVAVNRRFLRRAGLAMDAGPSQK